MRLTPAQLAVHLLCGSDLPPLALRHHSLAERVKAGHAMLVKITRQDFAYDLPAWHAYLRESRDGGYTWNRTIILPRIMKDALESEEWRNAVKELMYSP